ncbi:unnamed protein product [Lasius platythorax]|uniref:Uncharacterized protein n=1 Tax=Lasius platythorax TaxID=488582 RepID=A0AAV2P2U4_9HYME
MRNITRPELCLIISLDVGASRSHRNDLGNSIIKSERQQRCFEDARFDEIYGSVVAIRQDVSRRTSVDGYRTEERYGRKISVAKYLRWIPGKRRMPGRSERSRR